MLRRTSVFSAPTSCFAAGGFLSCTGILSRPVIIKMPALSPTMEKGTLVSWEKKVGEKITMDQTIAKVQTDKATNDFNHVGDDCFLARIIAEAGSIIDVGQPVALAVDEEEELNSDEIKNWKPPAQKKAPAAPKSKPPAASSPPPPPPPAAAAASASAASSPSKSGRPSSPKILEDLERSGPAVVRMAAALTGEQLEALAKLPESERSGLGGRFTKSDVLRKFPQTDFEVPSAKSYLAHDRSPPKHDGSSSKSSSKDTKSSSSGIPVAASYNISQSVQPGIVSKSLSDAKLLAYLINHSK